MGYMKETPRISIKFIDADTEEQLFEIKDRSWMNIGELFTDGIATSLIENDRRLKNKPLPQNVMILAVAEYNLQ